MDLSLRAEVAFDVQTGLTRSYLDHVLFLIKFPQCFTSGQFEKWHFRRDEPTEEVSEHDIVTERNDILNLPENWPMEKIVLRKKWVLNAKAVNRPGMPVVVVYHRNVLDCRHSFVQILFSVFKEPWLKPATDLVELAWFTPIDHVPSHQNWLLLGVHQALDKLIGLRVPRGFFKLLKV